MPRISLPFQLLKTFSENELTNFGKLLNSGYLSSGKSLEKLLAILKKYALHHERFTPGLQRDVYKALYIEENVGTRLNDQQRKKLNRLMNDLLNVAEKFLMFEDIKQTDQYDAMMLYPKLVDRDQKLLYHKRIRSIEKKLEKEQRHNVSYYEQYFQIQKVKTFFFYKNNLILKEDNYDKFQYYADIKYLLQKLQYHLIKITLQRGYAHKTFMLEPFKLLKAFLNFPEYQSNVLIKLYQLNINLIEKEEEATFLALTKLLREKEKSISRDILNTFYVNLSNFCTYQISEDNFIYYRYLFEIYKDMDNGNLLAIKNLIELALLKNIITTACRFKAFDWAIEKLNKYLKYVPKSIRESVLEYNLGIIAFNQQKYSEVFTHFARVSKIDDTHDLILRLTQLQCYYEVDTIFEDATQQMMDSLRIYINQNKKIADGKKPYYINFIKFLNKLYRYKDIPDRQDRIRKIKKTLPNIKEQIIQCDLVWRKPWLLEKVKELENQV